MKWHIIFSTTTTTTRITGAKQHTFVTSHTQIFPCAHVEIANWTEENWREFKNSKSIEIILFSTLKLFSSIYKTRVCIVIVPRNCTNKVVQLKVVIDKCVLAYIWQCELESIPLTLVHIIHSVKVRHTHTQWWITSIWCVYSIY